MKIVLKLLCLFVFFSAVKTHAWHIKGHETIVECAMPLLGDSIPSFFTQGKRLIAHCSGDPDLFKDRLLPQVRDAEYPNHFIDLELLQGRIAPATRSEFIALCAQMGLRSEKVGFLPYAVAEWTQRLAMIFAEHRKWPQNEEIKTKSLVYAGILAHYAGDLEMPLHLTIHYDGMSGADGTSPRSGIHDKVDALAEKAPRSSFAPDNFRIPLAYNDLMQEIWLEIQRVRRLIPGVYALETKLPAVKDTIADPEVRALAQERLASAAVFLADLYVTAWAVSETVNVPDWDEHGQKITAMSGGQPVNILDSLDQEESDLQDSVNALFSDVDTATWDNRTINCRHFDPAKWTDTVRMVLVDSTISREYIHPCLGAVTSPFGPRRRLWHKGVDIRLQRGDTVRAAFDGIVRVTKYERRGYGNVVVVRHANGLETIYGHLSKILVAVNQKVKAGELVGLGGNTGRSTGPHLHYEMRYRGEAFDPSCIVDFANGRLKHDTLVLTRKNFEYLIEMRKIKWCTVRKKETLGHIAIRYHTTVKKLCKLNHITPKTMIRAGQKLRYQ
jgi:murein DD-endopeptidase MepM/ murein hydrolase activator NlpD